MASRINVDEVLNLYSKGKSNKQIAKELKRDEHAIGKIIKNNNLKPYNSGSEFIKINNMDEIIGTLLGDSSIKYGTSKYPCLSFTHSIKQKEYYEYKVSLFSYLSTGKPFKPYVKDNKYGKSIMYSFNTKYLKCLEDVEKTFYVERKKIIPIQFLYSNFNDKSLALLFMDDGNLNHKSVNLNLQGFDIVNLQQFITFLKDRFDLEWTIQKNRSYYRLYLKTKSVHKFLNIVSPYIINSMRYKLPECHL